MTLEKSGRGLSTPRRSSNVFGSVTAVPTDVSTFDNQSPILRACSFLCSILCRFVACRMEATPKPAAIITPAAVTIGGMNVSAHVIAELYHKKGSHCTKRETLSLAYDKKKGTFLGK